MSGKNKLKSLLSSKILSLLVLTILLAVVINSMESSFISASNMRQLMINLTVPGFMLIATAPLLISGNIDLASDAEAALGAMVFAKFLEAFPQLPWGVGLCVAIITGILFGFVYILLVNKGKLVSFIASVAMMSVYNGIATMWTRTNNVNIGNESFNSIGGCAIANIIPVLFVVMLLFVVIYEYILKRTPIGRSVYMIGGNPYAAKLAGLDQNKIQAALFINNGIFSVLAGVAWCAFKKMASPTNISGAMASYDAMTACILGGVAWIGGSGTMFGSFVALLLIKMFFNGLNILDLPSYISVPLQGLILIIALIIDYYRTKRARAEN